MLRVKRLIKEAGVQGRVFARSTKYEFWEVDEILSDELIRSIALALICVFLIVIFLLANFTGAVLVLISVMFTIADVMGFMYFWGLTIDSTSCMLLIICIGLSVDYSAHIAHGFLHQTASSDITCREERLNLRIQNTLLQVGPAVFYGGLSTLLAVVFGLFHRLVFLPVILALVGPSHMSDEQTHN